ncbi:hypothetical protein Droror1_Dr00016894 [Drosera rotundifolia]
MVPSPTVTAVKVEDFEFPATVKAPGSDNTFILAGAGARGLEIQGKFIKFTTIGVYVEEGAAVSALGEKWKGKSAAELAESVEFFRDVVTGPFEKFTRVTVILPLTGKMYSEKVVENCVAIWKAIGIYTDAEAKAVEKFIEVFKDENFPPGNSILFTQSPLGSLTIAFDKHDSTPEVGAAVIENKHLTEAVLESIIGKHGVSPEAKQSLAERVSTWLNEKAVEEEAKVAVEEVVIQNGKPAEV